MHSLSSFEHFYRESEETGMLHPFRIFIVFVLIDAVRGQCNGNALTLHFEKIDFPRFIQSPNYGNENGKRSSCTWNITKPARPHTLVLHITNLRLHFIDTTGQLRCFPPYDLKINGERIGCKPLEFAPGGKRIERKFHSCNLQTTPLTGKQVHSRIQITFNTNGGMIPSKQPHDMTGFRIWYTFRHCSRHSRTQTGILSALTTVTSTIPATLTKQHPTISTVKGISAGKPPTTSPPTGRQVTLSSSIFIAKTTNPTTTMPATKIKTNTLKAIPTSSKSLGISSAGTDLSNTIPIWVSDVSNTTHGQRLTYTTSPTTNKSRGEDDFDTKLSFTIDLHWIILASALGGGLLLILVVAICCKIRRNKKSKVESEETDAGDFSSNHDKTELPAYVTVEDVSSNQKSTQQEATNQNAAQTSSNLEEKLVVENVAYESPQESPTTSISQPDSTLAESIQNGEDKPAIIDEPGDEFYSVVRLKSNNEKTTVRYLKENILYSEAP